jgi:integrase
MFRRPEAERMVRREIIEPWKGRRLSQLLSPTFTICSTRLPITLPRCSPAKSSRRFDGYVAGLSTAGSASARHAMASSAP